MEYMKAKNKMPRQQSRMVPKKPDVVYDNCE